MTVVGKRPAKAKSSSARIGFKDPVTEESKSRVKSSEARIEGSSLVQDEHPSNRDSLCQKQDTSEVIAEKATFSEEVCEVIPKSRKAKKSGSAKPKSSLVHSEDLEDMTESDGADNEVPASSTGKKSSRRSNSGAKASGEMPDKVNEESPEVPKHSKGKKSAKPKSSPAHSDNLEDVTESDSLNTEVPSSSRDKRSSRESNSGAKAGVELPDKVNEERPEVSKHSKGKKSDSEARVVLFRFPEKARIKD